LRISLFHRYSNPFNFLCLCSHTSPISQRRHVSHEGLRWFLLNIAEAVPTEGTETEAARSQKDDPVLALDSRASLMGVAKLVLDSPADISEKEAYTPDRLDQNLEEDSRGVAGWVLVVADVVDNRLLAHDVFQAVYS